MASRPYQTSEDDPVIDTVVAALQEALQDPLVTERFADLATTVAGVLSGYGLRLESTPGDRDQ